MLGVKPITRITLRSIALQRVAACMHAATRGGQAVVQRPVSTLAAHNVTKGTPLEGAPYATEVDAACQAVRLASSLCQTVQQQLSAAEKVDKSDDSPVTVADYGAQAVVAWALSKAAPDSKLSMVAEEDSDSLRAPEGAGMLERITKLVNDVIATVDGATPLTGQDVMELIDLGQSAGGPEGRHWVLDPIDGTRGFVGMRQYAVCLGLLQDGEVVAGVLGCPNLPQGAVVDEDGGAGAAGRSDSSSTGCLFLAHRGHGAYAAPLSGHGKPERIHVDENTDMAAARFMESYESRHSDHSFAARVAQQAGVTAPSLRMDSQVKYGLLARGEASVFLRFPPATYKEKIWDHCAGFVIVEEAGGKVTDASGARLDFSLGRWLDLDRGIVAAPAHIHDRVLQAVSSASS